LEVDVQVRLRADPGTRGVALQRRRLDELLAHVEPAAAGTLAFNLVLGAVTGLGGLLALLRRGGSAGDHEVLVDLRLALVDLSVQLADLGDLGVGVTLQGLHPAHVVLGAGLGEDVGEALALAVGLLLPPLQRRDLDHAVRVVVHGCSAQMLLTRASAARTTEATSSSDGFAGWSASTGVSSRDFSRTRSDSSHDRRSAVTGEMPRPFCARRATTSAARSTKLATAAITSTASSANRFLPFSPGSSRRSGTSRSASDRCAARCL